MPFTVTGTLMQRLYKLNNICGHQGNLNSASKETRLKFYKAMALPTLLYGAENWTPTGNQVTNIQLVVHIMNHILHVY